MLRAPELEEENAASDSGLRKSKLYRFEDRVRLLGRVAELDVDAIVPNPYQPRQHFDETALEELTASIRQLGVIQPLTVRSVTENQFQLISGERRLRAARRAGLKKVPAYVREADTEAMLEMAIVENIQRQDLNPIETALGYHRLIEECGLTQEQVATKVGKNRTTVTNFLRLLRLPPRVQASLRDGMITPGHARMLVSLPAQAVQYELLDQILKRDLSVRQVEQAVRELQKEKAEAEKAKPAKQTEAPPAPDAPSRDELELRELTDRLRTHFSTQVALQHRPDGSGKIELTYYSDEDLERLMELLLGDG